MSTQSDRRAPNANRIPFDAMVEVGGELGPSFEAQAVNLSEEGMHLRTAYLPDVGQSVSCRFDATDAGHIEAQGIVIWKEEMGRVGEFGIRFTNLDVESVKTLQRLLGSGNPADIGRVRLHIDGLASPMRARIREARGERVTATTELGFLQGGKPLELEDANTGERRPAHIDRVGIEVDPRSAVPQLVVTMRYEDGPAAAEEASDTDAEQIAAQAPVEDGPSPRDEMAPPPAAEAAEAAEAADEPAPAPRERVSQTAQAADQDDAATKFKGAFAVTAAKVGPAMVNYAGRAKTTLALLWAKRGAKKPSLDDTAPPRRTTAPPPGGGLHAQGRKVVRTESIPDEGLAASIPKVKITKRKAAVAGAVVIAGLLAVFALRKSPAPAAPPAAPPELAAAPTNAIPPPSPDPIAAAPITSSSPMTMPPDMLMGSDKSDPKGKKGKVVPFGNGPIGANHRSIKIKMDGPIDKIQGAPQPTGFTIVIPGRKTMDSAAPLASKDGRIAAIKSSNDPTGAELNVSFKDGVPNYQVRAKGDVLEIALAARDKASGGDADGAHKAQASHGKKKKPHAP